MLIFDELFKSTQMKFIDDFAHVTSFIQIRHTPIKFLHFLQQKFPEIDLQRLMDKDVIYSDTSLTGIEIFPEQNSVDCSWDDCGLINDHWAFTTQLQNARNQVLCSLNSHQTTCRCGARKTNYIHWETSDCFGNFDSPLNHSVVF